MLKPSLNEALKYLQAGVLSPSAGHNKHIICWLSKSLELNCNWTSSGTASFHLFIAVIREFPYRPVLSVSLGVFLVTTLCCYPCCSRKTSCGFSSFSPIVDIFGGLKVCELTLTCLTPSARPAALRKQRSSRGSGIMLSLCHTALCDYMLNCTDCQRLPCVLLCLSEGARVWLRRGVAQVQISARNEQQISQWPQ